MRVAPKVALSLLISTLVFAGIAFAAYAGLFSLVETRLYQPSVIANLEGQTYLLDIKTSSGVYGSTALQLTAYGNAEFYLDQDGTEQPMPTIDRYGVLHVTDYGTTLHYLPADQNEAAWKDFLHVQFVGRRAKAIDSYLTEETTND